MKYQMYVDEVGNPDTRITHDLNQRYLSLTGVIFDLDRVATIISPAVEDIKRRYFNSHPDEPVILHRKDIVQRRPPFESLRNDQIRSDFDSELLRMFTRWEYVVITTTMDKLEYAQRFQAWRFNPYHYCLTELVERFVVWLRQTIGTGDVMAESRGGTEDKKLKLVYSEIYSQGTESVAPDILQARLTSAELKVKPKGTNVAGLQISDLIAYPSYRATLCRRQHIPLPDDMNGKVATIVENAKYDRGTGGGIDGWGRI